MINKAVLMGRLTKDPELRYTQSNIPVCSFTLAIDRKFTQPGEQKQTDFIPCVAWNKSAEFVSKYFSKGRMAIVVGRIQVRSWDDNEGKKRYATEVIAEEVSFGETKTAWESNANRGGAPYMGSDAPSQPQIDPFASLIENAGGVEGGYVPIETEDDLPF